MEAKGISSGACPLGFGHCGSSCQSLIKAKHALHGNYFHEQQCQRANREAGVSVTEESVVLMKYK